MDCLHLIPAGPTDVATIIECIDFAQSEGKTTYNSLEVKLVKRLIDSIIRTTLPLGTELLISAYLAKVDNFGDRYQLILAKKLTREAVSILFYEFDMNNALNKRLIAMCVQKRVFPDESKQSVLFTLMSYGKELQEFEAASLESTEVGIENIDIEDSRPDPQSLR